MSFNALRSDELPQQLMTLLLELLRSRGLPEMAIAGAWVEIAHCLQGRPRLGPVAMELSLFGLAAEHLRAIGSPADMVSISRGKGGRAYSVIVTIKEVFRHFAGQDARADLEACVSYGLFDICVAILSAFASTGVAGLQDTNHFVVMMSLSLIGVCSSQPGCEVKIRGLATVLAFCMQHSLECIEEMGNSTGTEAAKVCCKVFGRDEGGSEFTFTPKHIELMTTRWSQAVRPGGYGHRADKEYVTWSKAWFKPTADTIFAAELCVSDKVSDSSKIHKMSSNFLTAGVCRVFVAILLLLVT